MFYDLNVPYSPTDGGLSRTLNFSHELGYNVVALNHTLSGKLPNEIVCLLRLFSVSYLTKPFKLCAIPNPLPVNNLPPNLTILRRATLILSETYQNARLAAISAQYDLLALRPVDEKSLQLACSSLDCDLISLDLSQRQAYHFKHKMLMEAIKAGKKFEICYSQALLGDAQARRTLIGNATQLIRATRGRGLVICSEAKAAVGLRGAWDAINLAAIWGLGQERGYEAMSKEARSAVVSAQLKRTGWRGTINVVYAGEKPAAPTKSVPDKKSAAAPVVQAGVAAGQKRKADGSASAGAQDDADKPLSKTQMKKRAKLEKMAADAKLKEGDGSTNAA